MLKILDSIKQLCLKGKPGVITAQYTVAGRRAAYRGNVIQTGLEQNNQLNINLLEV